MNRIDWNNPEEVREYHRNYKRKYRKSEENRKKHCEEQKVYYKLHREEILEKAKEKKVKRVKSSQSDRASNLISAYNQTDKKYNLGKGDLTAKWIVDNIFTQPCKYCGKTGWKIIGCNRLDNSKPHTMDNVEPCCAECNKKLPRIKGLKKNRMKLLETYKHCSVYETLSDAIRLICS